MGSLNFSGSSLRSNLIELVGYKCGVAISSEEMKEVLVVRGYEKLAVAREEAWVRLHSADYEDLIYAIMKHFGRLPEDFDRFAYLTFRHNFKHDAKALEIYDGVMRLYSERMPIALQEAIDNKLELIDPTKFLDAVLERYGMPGFEIAATQLENVNRGMTASPWSPGREIEWEDQIELKALFEQEGLNSQYGKFFDQRYIDFLHKNFEAIDRMHWRKFEQMTAEYLDREGYEVNMGPGRGDDGVDVRAWSRQERGDAPQIIVQCKRQKAAVEKVVIKALYADVVQEKANSGLLVTTSRIAPGAEDTRVARAYPIDVADRETLKQWLGQLRSPGSGGI